MTEAHHSPNEPVTAADIEHAVELAITALGEVGERDWTSRAETLEWDRWETVEHVASSLFHYGARLSAEPPQLSGPLPFDHRERRPGGARNLVLMSREAGPAALLQGLQVCAAMLAAVVRTTPAAKRAYHRFGNSDPEGFAAMAVVETLVHTHDVVQGLDIVMAPPGDLCARVLARIFPHVAQDAAAPWPTLLWATGRIEIEGHPRLGEWRWYSTPGADGGPVTGVQESATAADPA
jgi:hypothetical protein